MMDQVANRAAGEALRFCKEMAEAGSIENYVENLAEKGEENRREYQQGVADYKAGKAWDADRSNSWSEGHFAALLGEA